MINELGIIGWDSVFFDTEPNYCSVPNYRYFIASLCARFGVRTFDFYAPHKQDPLPDIRMIATALLVADGYLTYQEIANFMGRSCHGIVCTRLKRLKELKDAQDQWIQCYEKQIFPVWDEFVEKRRITP